MATRSQVLSLVGAGVSYDEVARRLGIDAGLAYLIATGLPADGSDALRPEDRDRPGFLDGSTQHLANSAEPQNPTQKQHVLDWIKQRAHSDAQMLEAAATRDAAPGDIEDPNDDHDVLDVLTRDHDQVTALLEQLSTIPGHKKGGSEAQVQRRASIVDMVSMALSRHESVEQEYFWPTVRSVLDDGDARADQALEQEQEGKDTLTALGKADPDSEEFDDLVEELVLRARKHVAFEDQVLLGLRDAMSAEERQELGKKMRRAQKMAPTRPHPHAPTAPGAAVKAAGAPAAALDKVRDAAGDRPAKRRGKAEGEEAAKKEQAAEARRKAAAKRTRAAKKTPGRPRNQEGS